MEKHDPMPSHVVQRRRSLEGYTVCMLQQQRKGMRRSWERKTRLEFVAERASRDETTRPPIVRVGSLKFVLWTSIIGIPSLFL